MGVRVWPSATNPRLMSSNGQLDVIGLQRLTSIIAQAARRGMIVDITFTREIGASRQMTAPSPSRSAQQAIALTASALRDRRNILFDLQNEWNNQAITIADLNAIKSAVTSQHPALLVTASTSGNSYREAAVNAFDVLAYHGSGMTPAGGPTRDGRPPSQGCEPSSRGRRESGANLPAGAEQVPGTGRFAQLLRHQHGSLLDVGAERQAGWSGRMDVSHRCQLWSLQCHASIRLLLPGERDVARIARSQARRAIDMGHPDRPGRRPSLTMRVDVVSS